MVPSDDRRRARSNCIRHLLDAVPYEKIKREMAILPERSTGFDYDGVASSKRKRVVSERYWRSPIPGRHVRPLLLCRTTARKAPA
ncbi:hypothetical protein [Methylocystis sp. ATCC 49242]|uniref:hypothetical protein n=1 Tax=Methylocystis sp. ATCC 49242 TaxID=622637 RepID=UPI00210FF125|nr:hypothetical protein [Methylocystis sp. ATCC 49242]